MVVSHIKKEKKIKYDVSKANHILLNQIHDLMLLSKVIKRSRGDTISSKRFIKLVRKRINSKGHIEDKFEHLMEGLEAELLDLEFSNPKVYRAIFRWLDDNTSYIHQLWAHMRQNGSIGTNSDVKEIEKDIDLILKALSNYSIVFKVLNKNLVSQMMRVNPYSVFMGKRVNDDPGNHSGGRFKRAVIVINNDNNDVVFIGTGVGNHQQIAGDKLYNDPGRHSFWYEYYDGDLVLHPAASEDSLMLEDWNKRFKDPHLKREIKKYIKYFS